MRRRILLTALLLASVLAGPPPACAHRMMAASLARGDGTVLLQAFFPDGRPAQSVKVEVRRPDGSLFLTGQTGEDGKLTIRPDARPGEWTAAFIGSMGHRAETTFVVSAVETAGPEAPVSAHAPVTQQARPVEENLARAEPFPWCDVLAGLGFIFGFSALLMCLKLRRDLQRKG